MNLYTESFRSDFSACDLATGINSYKDGPERTVAQVTFLGTPEQRKGDYEALVAALELHKDCDKAYGLLFMENHKLRAERDAIKEFAQDLAKDGLRFDLNPCHDMTSQQTSEEFWHRYAKRMDASIRERATEALGAQS